MTMISLLMIIFSLHIGAQEICTENGGANCMLEMADNKPVFSTLATSSLNVFGRGLKPCSKDPITGFYRDGSCRSDIKDRGNHSVCGILTDGFLEFTKSQGNDLSTPNLRYDFPGLKAGNRWCLCASRWLEAKKAGFTMQVDLDATSIRSLEVTTDFDLKGKNRVIYCAPSSFQKQFEILQKDKGFVEKFSIISFPLKKLKKGCQFFGIDGNFRERSDTIFTFKQLQNLVSQKRK